MREFLSEKEERQWLKIMSIPKLQALVYGTLPSSKVPEGDARSVGDTMDLHITPSDTRTFVTPRVNTKTLDERSFSDAGPSVWSSLLQTLRHSDSASSLKEDAGKRCSECEEGAGKRCSECGGSRRKAMLGVWSIPSRATVRTSPQGRHTQSVVCLGE